MNDKILLSELSFEDAKRLLSGNKWLQTQVYDYSMDCISYDISEIARYLDKVNYIDYSLGGVYGDYIKVNYHYYKEFIDAVRELDKDLCIFPESFNFEKLDRIYNKLSFYDDCNCGYEDISDRQFELLEKWIESGVNDAVKAILNYIDGLQDYDEDYYLESWLDICGGDYETDKQYIYELTVKKYA